MPTSTSQVKSAVVSTVALLTLVPWQLLLAAGFTFTFREHEPTVLWAFVWFLFLLDVPAVLLSFWRPRFTMWWVVGNAVTALVTWCFVADSSMRWSQPAGEVIAVFGPKFLFLVALWWANRANTATVIAK